MQPAPPRVSALYLYPFKSLAGVAVQAAEVGDRGLEGDRRWMVTDPAGAMRTQRKLPRMAQLQVDLGEQILTLRAPGRRPLEVPRALTAGTPAEVTVWKDRLDALEHPPASAWLSEALGLPCRAVYMPDRTHRPVDPKRAQPGDQVSFADGFPLLAASEASLAALNARLERPVDMRRFRPNVVVSGVDAFAEDRWARVRLGEITFRGPKLCERCVMTTVDPDTGERTGPEPLRSLAELHTVGGRICFGINLVQDGRGALAVGDPVAVLQEQRLDQSPR
jgi:uncharacterized protein YcbX